MDELGYNVVTKTWGAINSDTSHHDTIQLTDVGLLKQKIGTVLDLMLMLEHSFYFT